MCGMGRSLCVRASPISKEMTVRLRSAARVSTIVLGKECVHLIKPLKVCIVSVWGDGKDLIAPPNPHMPFHPKQTPNLEALGSQSPHLLDLCQVTT